MTANLTTLCAELRRLKQKATSDGARLADSDALIAAMRNALPALLDAAERVAPVLTPRMMEDARPLMTWPGPGDGQ